MRRSSSFFTAWALILAPAAALAQTVAPPAQPFGFEVVEAKAHALAGQKLAVKGRLPRALEDLSYDQHRDIRFRLDKTLWRDKGLFQVQFFHLGFLYDRPVEINTVNRGVVSRVPYAPDLFDYGKTTFKKPLPKDLGFAGVRVHHPLHTPRYFDELIVFLGASYFRVLGREQQYGISARGLAIDTALSKGEEFPFFRELWLETPAPDSTTFTIYALLDSPSVTGAYKFDVHPGTVTTVDVTLHLFARDRVEKLGIAPLTSMMLFGEHRGRDFDDFRPEVHDSDTLLVQNASGEWVARPLINPPGLQVTAYMSESPRGFGLLQRDRDPSHYQDLEAYYEKRPSYWVEPLAPWGPGHVELVEIPSTKEGDDNMVAYWVGATELERGKELSLRYRLHASLSEPPGPPLGKVVSTRIGSGSGKKDARHFAIDFAGPELAILRPDQPVDAQVTSSRGRVTQIRVQKNEAAGGWRVYFTFSPDGDEPADFRCWLRLRGRVLSETWTYLWSPR